MPICRYLALRCNTPSYLVFYLFFFPFTQRYNNRDLIAGVGLAPDKVVSMSVRDVGGMPAPMTIVCLSLIHGYDELTPFLQNLRFRQPREFPFSFFTAVVPVAVDMSHVFLTDAAGTLPSVTLFTLVN